MYFKLFYICKKMEVFFSLAYQSPFVIDGYLKTWSQSFVHLITAFKTGQTLLIQILPWCKLLSRWKNPFKNCPRVWLHANKVVRSKFTPCTGSPCWGRRRWRPSRSWRCRASSRTKDFSSGGDWMSPLITFSDNFFKHLFFDNAH
jgi:hypothetical protein